MREEEWQGLVMGRCLVVTFEIVIEVRGRVGVGGEGGEWEEEVLSGLG